MNRRCINGLLAMLLVLGLAGCSLLPQPDITSTPDTSGVSASLRPFYGQRIVWKACDDGFRCATAKAPIDWADPSSGKPIRLALTMHPASGTRIGTLFVNPGGPGASGVQFLQQGLNDFFDKALRDSYDIVAWDPRGVGESTAVDCYGTAGMDRFLFADPDLPSESAALEKNLVGAGTAFGKACQARTGPLLAHVGTADTVTDLDMLRAATGESKLDYFGFSYGTSIGAQYANRYPTRVGRMVLDGAVDPALTAFQENLANTRAFGAALEKYLAACLKSSNCPFRGESVDEAVDTIAALIVRLRASPIRAADGREVNGTVLRTAITSALYDEGAWKYLTQAFEELRQGRAATTQALADQYVDRGKSGYSSNLFEAIYAVNCLDDPVETDPATLEREGAQLLAADPLRAADNAEDFGDTVCGNWPIKPESKPGPVTAVGSPPILVLGTTGDPATPYAWAEALASQLPKGVLLTLRGEGHTAYRNDRPCINDRVDTYLVRGTVPAAVTCS